MLPTLCNSPGSIPLLRHDTMSIYSHCGISTPAIAYCITHQSAPKVTREEYGKTLEELHRRIKAESTSIVEGYPRTIHEAALREAQMVKGVLSPFLQTPIQSDPMEVRRILEDSLEKFAGRLVDSSGPGLRYSLEGRAFVPPSKRTVERRLLQQGKTYLGGLGFGMEKRDPSVHESMFVVEGGSGLDILEHIVRDRLGIYTPTHGKHLLQFQRTSYASYNLLHALGAMPPPAQIHGCTEAAVFFAKPHVRYGEFREHLTALMNDLAAAVEPDHCSLWQRKLGLGSGVEFVLRVVAGSAAKISGSVHWLATATLEPSLKQALLAEGRLVLKELLFST